jgi:hypothetical protein
MDERGMEEEGKDREGEGWEIKEKCMLIFFFFGIVSFI